MNATNERTRFRVLVGTPFLAIIRDVISRKRDLVMMTAGGKGGLKARLFGSTSLHLMRKCPCPVWVMKPTRRKRFLRVLAAVDPDPEDTTRDALNALILRLAASLAEQERAELHVAHAWTTFGETFLCGRVFGLGRFGNHISRELAERERRVLGVDFDPDLVHRLREADHAVVYGDAEDPEFASTLPLSSARWVVSSVPQLAVNLALLQALSRHGYSGQIATTAYNDRDAERLRDAGSDLILLPFLDAAKEAVDELCGFVNSSPIDDSLSSVLPPEDSR